MILEIILPMYTNKKSQSILYHQILARAQNIVTTRLYNKGASIVGSCF